MVYPDDSKLSNLIDQIHLYSHLKREHGAQGVDGYITKANRSLQEILNELKSLPGDGALS